MKFKQKKFPCTRVTKSGSIVYMIEANSIVSLIFKSIRFISKLLKIKNNLDIL